MGPDSHQTWCAPRVPPAATLHKIPTLALSPFPRCAPFIINFLSFVVVLSINHPMNKCARQVHALCLRAMLTQLEARHAYTRCKRVTLTRPGRTSRLITRPAISLRPTTSNFDPLLAERVSLISSHFLLIYRLAERPPIFTFLQITKCLGRNCAPPSSPMDRLCTN